MAHPTLTVEMIDGVQLLFVGERAISDEDWDHNLDQVRKYAKTMRGVLVAGHPESPGINATQRRRGADVWREVGVDPRIAILTDSTFQRGVVTAIAWVTPGTIRAFAVADWRAAATFAGAEPRTLPKLRIALEQHASRCGAPLRFPE